jgi:hypothetical protein
MKPLEATGLHTAQNAMQQQMGACDSNVDNVSILWPGVPL